MTPVIDTISSFEDGAEIDIASIEKGKDTIKIRLVNFKGHPRIDIRLWFENGEGKLLPTSKGLTLKVDSIEEICEALQQAKSTYETLAATATTSTTSQEKKK